VAQRDERRELLRFASEAVHEIAGPIDQVSSLAALFVNLHRGTVDEEADVLLSHIEAGRTRLGLVGASLRKFFQVSTAELHMASLDMNGVAEGAVSALGRQIAESGAAVQVERLPSAWGDRELLGMLFEALIENAIKFRRPGTAARVVISGGSFFEVVDNGIGVDPGQREGVFEPFRKLNGHIYPGAGMGLTLAQVVSTRDSWRDNDG
jgi:light-regulated signal transduction histidine kinase (bacteriophytochrome)